VSTPFRLTDKELGATYLVLESQNTGSIKLEDYEYKGQDA